MKWDFAIGNPPYQTSIDTYNRQEPIYPHFYDAAESVADKYLLISPARFLFNAGLTPKEWNTKMLSDEHVKVKYYNQSSSEVFSNTEIKGGVAVMYRDSKQCFGAIGEFVPDENLRKIASHFIKDEKENLPSIIFGGRSDLKFNEMFIKEHPESKQDRLRAIQKKHPEANALGPNEEYELKSSTLDILPYAFLEEKPATGDYYKIIGLMKGKRAVRWIDRKYMSPRYPKRNNISKYKVFVPESNGGGEFGIVLSSPLVGEPYMSATPTFISIGAFDTKVEAENALKYIKTKLVRALLCLLKTTQHNSPANWAYIPVQNFTTSSDINWNTSIANIDKQLYKKYGLSQEEIDFIETHVKEMA